MIRNKMLFLLVAVLGTSFCVSAQPFANEIADFRKKDAASFPPKNGILFVGSSSFRLWENLEDYFPGKPLINRGFGGSTLPDVIRYEEDIIFPYAPKQIVIYCGENDIAASDTVSAKLVCGRFEKLFTDIRQRLPDVPVLFVSIKPSPSRWALRDRMIEANKLIRSYLKKQSKAEFVDVWNAMLDATGEPRKDIFRADSLHMNATGYAIWKKLMEPYLLD